MSPNRFVRRPFFVDALRVSADNMAELALWCRGEIITANTEPFIRVLVTKPLNQSSTKSRAFVGDWVVYTSKGFKVYTHVAFEKTFVSVKEDVDRNLVTISSELGEGTTNPPLSPNIFINQTRNDAAKYTTDRLV